LVYVLIKRKHSFLSVKREIKSIGSGGSSTLPKCSVFGQKLFQTLKYLFVPKNRIFYTVKLFEKRSFGA